MAAQKRDYYEVLGIERDAELSAIKAAYRTLARKFHPDRNPGDAAAEERFKEAAEAYAVLSDAEQRARYDRYGHRGIETGPAGFDPNVFADFSDILGDLFGFGSRGREQRPGAGADLRYDLRISFAEAAFGAERTLAYPRLEVCAECSGSGGKGGSKPRRCSACGGRGQVAMSQGFFTIARTCPQCGGRGAVHTDPCRSCRGEGRVERERTLQLKVPAGVEDGTRLRMSGEGDNGVGGRTGDLYVVLHVGPHQRFERRGADTIAEEPIAYAQAVLGGSVEIDTLHGPRTLEVPPGAQHGQLLRLRGEGIPRLDGRGRGDHVVALSVSIPDPRALKPESVELLRKLAEIEGVNVRADRGVMSRVKDLFGP